MPLDPSLSFEDHMASVQALAKAILDTRNDAVEARASSGIERQWREDQRAFEGKDGTTGRTDMLDFATGEAWVGDRTQDKKQSRSRVIVNIIRGKCETAEGRFGEIVLPTDDKNWGLKPSPISEELGAAFGGPRPQVAQPPAPTVAPQPSENPQVGGGTPAPSMGQPAAAPVQSGMLSANAPSASPTDPQAQQEAKDAEAKKRCSAMEEEIDDQLEESNFNTECRKAHRSAVRLGTGILKGPNVIKSVKRSWVEQNDGQGNSVFIMKMVERYKPASVNVDIWDVYPDRNCGHDPKRGAYIWERGHILPREVRELIGVPGYNTDQLRKVMEEEPIRTVVTVDKGGDTQRVTQTKIKAGAPYERWEYYGDVDKDVMALMGCECSAGSPQAVSAAIVFINDRPVKVQLNSLDTGELPYDFFQWVQQDDSPWGIGEPRKLIWQQRIITAAWRAMMDNAGDSAGAMLVMNKDVEPEDGIWAVTGKKIWINESDDQPDARAAFAQFQLQNNQADLQRVIELSLKFIDMESGTPMIAQGEKGSAPETLGGMQMLMSAADTTRKQQVKNWDDQITRPHLRRYVDWNMQYNKKNNIKGDFDVDPRGTSVLLVKDQAAQALLQIFQLKQDPDVSMMVDWTKVVKQLFQARHLDVLKTDDEIEAAKEAAKNAQAPMAPAVQVAQIREEGATTRKKMDLADNLEERHLDRQLEAQLAQQDQQLQLVLGQVKERIEGIKDQGAREIAFEQLKAMLAGTSMKLDVQKDLSLSGHIADLHKHHNPAPQVITPPTEPAGQAPDGEAFQA